MQPEAPNAGNASPMFESVSRETQMATPQARLVDLSLLRRSLGRFAA